MKVRGKSFANGVSQNSFFGWVTQMFRRASRLERFVYAAVRPKAPPAPRPDDEPCESVQSSVAPSRAFVSHPNRVYGLDRAQSVHPTAAFHIHENMPVGNPLGQISLGPGSYIGKEVEFATCNFIIIGKDTSIQDYCRVSGDTVIGAHCVFAPYIFIGSGIHRFRDRPEWLIRDQDKAVFDNPAMAVEPITRPVIIEDDCWLGWSVVICPGVYVGRGAIVGANTVVTKDIGPYEIHGGNPSRKIGERLGFSPPRSLDPLDDKYLPYFYRGFDLSQARLGITRAQGFVEAGERSTVVLEYAVGKKMLLRGTWLGMPGLIRLRLNGADCGPFAVHSGPFEIAAEIPDHRNEELNKVTAGSVPDLLKKYTYIEIEDVTPDQMPDLGNIDQRARYGLSTIAVLP
jgi:acetyltransferase-like isoleucine patch superfamily enzyme